MRERVQLLDMTPEGEFVTPKVHSTWPLRLGIGAAILAVTTASLLVAALFLWVASILLPVALVAAAVAYGAFRFQAWRVAQNRKHNVVSR
jgi:hypothetical protein